MTRQHNKPSIQSATPAPAPAAAPTNSFICLIPKRKLMDKQASILKKVYEPSKEVKKRAIIKDYDKIYNESIANPETFWAAEAKKLDWYKNGTECSIAPDTRL